MPLYYIGRNSTLARRVDVVREYLLKEYDLDLPEEEVIKEFCPASIRYDIYKLGIHIDEYTCTTSDCTECWNEEIIIERVDPPLQEGDILKKIDGKWYLIKGGIAYEYEEVAE